MLKSTSTVDKGTLELLEEQEERLIFMFRDILEILYVYDIVIKPDIGLNLEGGLELEWDLEEDNGLYVVVDFIPGETEDIKSYTVEYAILKTEPGNKWGTVNTLSQFMDVLDETGVLEHIT